MDTLQNLIQAIIVIVALYALAIIMRWRKVLSEDNSLLLAKMVTDLFLPATIFVTIAGQSIHLGELAPALVMLCLEISAIAVAWTVSVLLHFKRAEQGAIVFCAAFGSSTFLGYPIIMQMFPDKPQAMTEAVLISEIGVGYTLFIIGPILAAYFGSMGMDARSRWMTSLSFFKSPVFFSLVAGLLWGILNLPGKENAAVGWIFNVGHTLAGGMTPMAILSVGLMIKMPKIRTILVPLAIVIVIKLLLKPLAAGYVSSMLGFPDLWQEVLVILAAMPPAVLGPIFLKRYGSGASLASTLLLSATVVSIGTLLLIFALFV